MKIIMHIDVNNAFLSWSAIDMLNKGFKIDIRNTYAIIGGEEKERRGIVLAKSTPAKKRGVTTGETIYMARKKCPNLKSYPPNYTFYKKMSNLMFNLIKSYSPDIEKMSIDECFLDYTPVKNLYGNEIEFAYKLKKEIYEKLGFTVNIGIANNKICAKMASDFTKPFKVHTLYQNEVKDKMWPLKVDKLFGIGKSAASKLHTLNINTISDLAQTDEKYLYKFFKNRAKTMIDSAQGIGSDYINSEKVQPKGIGNETTLKQNIYTKEKLYPILLALSENVSLRLRREEKYSYVVALTIKDKFFKRKSHQKRLQNATNITEEIYKKSKEILNEMNIEDGVRLIGIRLEELVSSSNHQTSLFEDIKEREGSKRLEKTVDKLKEKYGYKVIKKASLKTDNIENKYLNK